MRQVALGLVVVLVGCDSPPAEDAPAGTATTASPSVATTTAPSASAADSVAASAAPLASASASAAPAKTSRGLHAEGNDPDVVIQIETVRDACKWTGESFADGCMALQGWVEWAAWPGRQDITETLVRVLFDDNLAVRHLAAVGLGVIGTRPIRDREVATALFDALEGETNPKNCSGIALQAGAVLHAETGLDPRAIRAIRSHRLAPCRTALIEGLASYNPQHHDLLIELARSEADTDVRRAAMGSMRGTASKDVERQRTNCRVWLEILDGSTGRVTDRVVELVGGTGVRAGGAPCADEWDAMLTKVDAMASRDDDSAAVSPWGLVALLEQKRATEEQRAKAVGICKKLVEREANDDAIRAAGLDCVGAHDPDAKRYAGAFVDDPSPKVGAAAKRIAGTTE